MKTKFMREAIRLSLQKMHGNHGGPFGAVGVRRGAELVGGQGGAAPDFTFATIYRLRQWSRGRLANVLKSGKFLSRSQNPAGLFGV